MITVPRIEAKPEAVRKFYFLDYFYVLLKSVQIYTRSDKIFEHFLRLKEEHQLGESKYKRLTVDPNTSSSRMVRYKYTFDQVFSEAEDYQFLTKDEDVISLTEVGKMLIERYENKELVSFNHLLLKFMEDRYSAFRYIVEGCYRANPIKSGLLIFPIYSAYRLGIERDSIRTAHDLLGYFGVLTQRLEDDISKHLGMQKSLTKKNEELVQILIDVGLLPRVASETFEASKYNVILKRARDFWLKYFLKDLYEFDISLNSFEIWAYRGKQIGTLHITEFYPDPSFFGRIVYPLSVIRDAPRSENFRELCSYADDMKLYIHQPVWETEQNQEEFVQSLYQAYLDVRQSAKSYFVNLASVRERVCYSMKIPGYLFDAFLGHAYHGRLRIRISLEVDRLPEETKLMYLMREPVMVDNRYRNIIAIDLGH